MIISLSGVVTDVRKGVRSYVELEIVGIGYEVQVPKSAIERLELHFDTKLYTYQTFSERTGTFSLYGFLSKQERELFKTLISVNGIGAQMAIALIDTLGINTLVASILSSNYNQLIRAPGVGLKGAERLCVEVKKKIKEFSADQGMGDDFEIESMPTGIPAAAIEEVTDTLMALQYSGAEIKRAIAHLSQAASGSESADQLCLEAMQFLAA